MPGMGRTGTAAWEANETFDDADYEMVLKNVSDGFRFGSDSIIYCIECGVEAIVGPNSPSKSRPPMSHRKTDLGILTPL
jgi:hypothetical protein